MNNDMNDLSEHPQAIGLSKRIAASEANPKFVTVLIFMPGAGPMMGTVRQSKVPGLFTLSSNVDIQGTGAKGVMDFDFTADQPTMINYADLTQVKPDSKIVS